jgi:hypothetical protein
MKFHCFYGFCAFYPSHLCNSLVSDDNVRRKQAGAKIQEL